MIALPIDTRKSSGSIDIVILYLSSTFHPHIVLPQILSPPPALNWFMIGPG
jgi:hypothetical protein